MSVAYLYVYLLVCIYNVCSVLHSFDVIALSETWLNDNNQHIFHLEGFHFICHNRSKKRGGGVAFFVNKLIKHDIVQKLSISIDNVVECITVELCLKHKIYVCCVYRQPQSSITYFTDHMENMFHSLNGNIYVCGDLNIYLSEYNNNNGYF